jgi:hypothetical protein
MSLSKEMPPYLAGIALATSGTVILLATFLAVNVSSRELFLIISAPSPPFQRNINIGIDFKAVFGRRMPSDIWFPDDRCI